MFTARDAQALFGGITAVTQGKIKPGSLLVRLNLVRLVTYTTVMTVHGRRTVRPAIAKRSWAQHY